MYLLTFLAVLTLSSQSFAEYRQNPIHEDDDNVPQTAAQTADYKCEENVKSSIPKLLEIEYAMRILNYVLQNSDKLDNGEAILCAGAKAIKSELIAEAKRQIK